ncbi:MAG: prolyl-tRNA synthetase associated domain-containing protein [Alphaproteobacteria bacterium]|nr:prolyl-tRNA synthetase associated domain-containing protein [Alphaproteobacteria bacterium]
MPATPEQLFSFFDQLGIAHRTVSHPPLFTVEDGRGWHDKIPGLHCKNLFLKDKKGGVWLVVMPGDKRANLAQLEKRLGAPRFSFGKPELLKEVLGITPGAVTPFALMNDAARRVAVVLDADMMSREIINFHPLRNDASTAIAPADLLLFIKELGYRPVIADCGE